MKFEQLPLEVKVKIIVRDGHYLGTTQSTIFQADLYSVGNRYIEVLLFPATSDFVHVREIDSSSIDKYLTPISLKSLTQRG